jgi:hypothetical protein
MRAIIQPGDTSREVNLSIPVGPQSSAKWARRHAQRRELAEVDNIGRDAASQTHRPEVSLARGMGRSRSASIGSARARERVRE